MQDLTPVGLSQDRTQLLLVSATGEEYAVPADARLRAALRGENARGQLEMKMDSALRPRDIQARIRAGESTEDVATAAQTTVDGIMAFAGPVLAERAHVAATAQRASVRRRGGEAGVRTLGEAAELFFSGQRLHDEDVEWDAWRRPDGRWALVATYAVQGRPARAEFTHDLPGRYVVAENDDARVLIGELRLPGAETETAPVAARRLSTVRSHDELPLGDDAIELVRDRDETPAGPPAAVSSARSATDTEETAEAEQPAGPKDSDDPSGPSEPSEPAQTEQPALIADVEDTVPVRDAPGDRPAAPARGGATAMPAPRGGAASSSPEPFGMDPLPFDPGADTADADWLVAEDTALVERPGARAQDERDVQAPIDEPVDEPAAQTSAQTSAQTPAQTPAQAESRPEPKKKGRSSVPSWDEIMFGGGKSD